MGKREVTEFLKHLAVERQVSANTSALDHYCFSSEASIGSLSPLSRELK